MRLYLNDKPRTFVLTTSTHALIIRHPNPTYEQKGIRSRILGHKRHHSEKDDCKVLVEFVLKDYINLSSYRDVTPKRNKLLGFIGLLPLKGKVFLGFITQHELVASPTLDDKIYRITGTEFYCLNCDEYDYIFDREFDELRYQDNEKVKYPGSSVRKLLSSGAFFYSRQFDITSTIQERGIGSSDFRLIADASYFRRFLWNMFMIEELLEFRNRLTLSEQRLIDETGFLIIIARGYAKTVNTEVAGQDALLTLISKQSSAKEGPIFGHWGCDGNGCVANYLESEVILYTEHFCLSYVIARGNVPMYWELENKVSTKNIIGASNKRIIFPRSFEASQEAFTRHMDRLAAQYGDVHVINELSDKSYKGVLNASFEEQIKYFLKNRDPATSDYKFQYTHLPIPAARIKKIGYTSQNPSEILSQVVSSARDFGALFYDDATTSFVGKQLGVFRINSFDSLSKANFLSKVISQEVIELAFGEIGIHLDRELFTSHAKLWKENDIIVTQLTLNFVSYSDKLHTSKKSNASSVKSHITKKYLSGVVDNTKPNELALLKLLGRLQDQSPIALHNPLHDYIDKELTKRSKEFTSELDISVFASTFNVNATFYEGDIDEWILPHGNSHDLVFIGLQEIVELKPNQMMAQDFKNKTLWERKILNCLAKKDKYMVMWSGQLGGLLLLLFVRESQVKYISNIEISFKKTGLGGMAANKGGIAVSFKYSDTTMCFVSSHLAAGLSNTEERHNNYKTLIKGIKFSKNRRIPNHDVVIWLGDFNFRIDLTNEEVKSLIHQKQYGKLYEHDQLNRQMANGETFPFFAEQEIHFPPTYKFDNGTRKYDSSEKQRVPAWTDRILYMSRKNLIKPMDYECIDNIVFSDHRAVYALFQITVKIVNQVIKKKLSNELYETYNLKDGGLQDLSALNYDLDKKSANFENEKLPPPSSDKQKWWLDGGKPARVNIPRLNEEGNDLVVNPWHPINPFVATTEPEFVSRREVESMLN